MAEEQNEALQEQLAAAKDLQSQLAAIDTDGNKTLSKAEIAAALVEDWKKKHPNDDLELLKNQVEKAAALRAEVEAAAGSTKNDLRTQLMNGMVAHSLGQGEHTGSGEIPENAENVIAFHLKQSAQATGVSMTEGEMQRTAKDVAQGMKYANWLEQALPAYVASLSGDLEVNAQNFEQAKGDIASKRRRTEELDTEIAEKKKTELTPESIKKTLEKSALHATDEQKQKVVDTLMPMIEQKKSTVENNEPIAESAALKLTTAQMQQIQAAREAVSNYQLESDAANLSGKDVTAAIAVKKGATR